MRRRLDLEMVRRGLAATRSEAAMAIGSGRVTVRGRPSTNAGRLVLPEDPIVLARPGRRFVSRGGEKLDGALAGFGIDARGRSAMDVGSSTGGFTDCLLSRGAARVLAVDVGYGQLDWRLRQDARVVVMERTNARTLSPDALPWQPDLIVADLSFVSLGAVLPALTGCAAPGADLVLLVKPQFEAERGRAPGGVVSDATVWRRAVASVSRSAEEAGAGPAAVLPSALLGPKGNVEFFLWAVLGKAATLDGEALDEALVRGGAMGRAANG